MRITKIHQVKVINAKSPEDYEKQFNEVMCDVADYSPTFQQDASNPFLVFIYYDIDKEEPENVRDVYKLEGREFYCGQCPNFYELTDKRMKPKCLLHGFGTRAERSACEEWLKEIRMYELMHGKKFYPDYE